MERKILSETFNGQAQIVITLDNGSFVIPFIEMNPVTSGIDRDILSFDDHVLTRMEELRKNKKSAEKIETQYLFTLQDMFDLFPGKLNLIVEKFSTLIKEKMIYITAYFIITDKKLDIKFVLLQPLQRDHNDIRPYLKNILLYSKSDEIKDQLLTIAKKYLSVNTHDLGKAFFFEVNDELVYRPDYYSLENLLLGYINKGYQYDKRSSFYSLLSSQPLKELRPNQNPLLNLPLFRRFIIEWLRSTGNIIEVAPDYHIVNDVPVVDIEGNYKVTPQAIKYLREHAKALELFAFPIIDAFFADSYDLDDAAFTTQIKAHARITADDTFHSLEERNKIRDLIVIVKGFLNHRKDRIVGDRELEKMQRGLEITEGLLRIADELEHKRDAARLLEYTRELAERITNDNKSTDHVLDDVKGPNLSAIDMRKELIELFGDTTALAGYIDDVFHALPPWFKYYQEGPITYFVDIRYASIIRQNLAYRRINVEKAKDHYDLFSTIMGTADGDKKTDSMIKNSEIKTIQRSIDTYEDTYNNELRKQANKELLIKILKNIGPWVLVFGGIIAALAVHVALLLISFVGIILFYIFKLHPEVSKAIEDASKDNASISGTIEGIDESSTVILNAIPGLTYDPERKQVTLDKTVSKDSIEQAKKKFVDIGKEAIAASLGALFKKLTDTIAQQTSSAKPSKEKGITVSKTSMATPKAKTESTRMTTSSSKSKATKTNGKQTTKSKLSEKQLISEITARSLDLLFSSKNLVTTADIDGLLDDKVIQIKTRDLDLAKIITSNLKTVSQTQLKQEGRGTSDTDRRILLALESVLQKANDHVQYISVPDALVNNLDWRKFPKNIFIKSTAFTDVGFITSKLSDYESKIRFAKDERERKYFSYIYDKLNQYHSDLSRTRDKLIKKTQKKFRS